MFQTKIHVKLIPWHSLVDAIARNKLTHKSRPFAYVVHDTSKQVNFENNSLDSYPLCQCTTSALPMQGEKGNLQDGGLMLDRVINGLYNSFEMDGVVLGQWTFR